MHLPGAALPSLLALLRDGASTAGTAPFPAAGNRRLQDVDLSQCAVRYERCETISGQEPGERSAYVVRFRLCPNETSEPLAPCEDFGELTVPLRAYLEYVIGQRARERKAVLEYCAACEECWRAEDGTGPADEGAGSRETSCTQIDTSTCWDGCLGAKGRDATEFIVCRQMQDDFRTGDFYYGGPACSLDGGIEIGKFYDRRCRFRDGYEAAEYVIESKETDEGKPYTTGFGLSYDLLKEAYDATDSVLSCGPDDSVRRTRQRSEDLLRQRLPESEHDHDTDGAPRGGAVCEDLYRASALFDPDRVVEISPELSSWPTYVPTTRDEGPFRELWPTPDPTADPTAYPTSNPTEQPTKLPTGGPSKSPSRSPSGANLTAEARFPGALDEPTSMPTAQLGIDSLQSPTKSPSLKPISTMPTEENLLEGSNSGHQSYNWLQSLLLSSCPVICFMLRLG